MKRQKLSLLKGLIAGSCCAISINFAGCAGLQNATELDRVQEDRVVVPTKPRRLPPLSNTTGESQVRFVALNEPASPETLVPNPTPHITRSAVGIQPRSVAEAINDGRVEVIDPSTYELPMDLSSALAIIAGQSPAIAHAAARYDEAYARLAGAKVLWVPSIRAGVSYHHHDGNLQNAAGAILDVDRSSLQGGLGVGAVGAGTTPVPGVVAQFHTTDAVFQPRIHENATAARSHAIDAASNDALLEGALAYLELLRAEQIRVVALETKQNADRLSELTTKFADSGEGPQADADRAKTEAAIRSNDVTRAEEAVEIASSRLVEVLSADPHTRIVPSEPVIVPLHLLSPDQSAGELLAIGLANRPELAEVRHLVCEAVNRYERERYAPLMPSVLLGMSESSFGGGLAGNIANNDHRFDFDAVAFWELRNFGFGERAARDERWSVYEQRQLEEVRLMDQVAREINVAHAQVRSRSRQIAIAEAAVTSATESLERNETRIEQGVGLPIEMLQAIQALDQAQREYVRTVADYNAAQFSLHRAIGWAIH